MRALAILTFPLAFACSIPTKVTGLNMDIPRQAVPIVIGEGINALDDPANKAKIAAMLASPEMKGIEAELVRGMVDGSLAALSDPERADKIAKLGAQYTAVVMKSFTDDVAPQMGGLVSNMMQRAVREAFSPASTAAISSALTRDLGPAIQQVLSDNLAPGIAAALKDEEVKRALGDMARVLGKQVVLGINDGMVEVENRQPKGDPSALSALGALADKSANIASGLTWMLAAVVVVLCGLLVKLLMQARKYKSEIEQREAETKVIEEKQVVPRPLATIP